MSTRTTLVYEDAYTVVPFEPDAIHDAGAFSYKRHADRLPPAQIDDVSTRAEQEMYHAVRQAAKQAMRGNTLHIAITVEVRTQ